MFFTCILMHSSTNALGMRCGRGGGGERADATGDCRRLHRRAQRLRRWLRSLGGRDWTAHTHARTHIVTHPPTKQHTSLMACLHTRGRVDARTCVRTCSVRRADMYLDRWVVPFDGGLVSSRSRRQQPKRQRRRRRPARDERTPRLR